MFWADKIVKKIINSGKYQPYWVDDMKTPSGRIHVGSLRGIVIHDLIFKALVSAGQKATFTYVFEDHDPMDALPQYLDKTIWNQYLGQPLFTIPSPDGKSAHFGQYYAQEFKKVFNKIGCYPDIIWMSEIYKSGKMNSAVKMCLDNASEIRKIYEKMYKKKLPDNWYPFQVVCPTCGKESTTKISAWDGNDVTFVCNVDAVNWTKGCGTEGKVSPFSGNGKYAGKLPWKVEWPVKWKVIGVTIEGAGKDHMSAGGSHDVAKLVCEKVLHYPIPYPVAYEFFLVGGKKMSSSKGLGSSAKEISEILPPYLLRFLFTRTDYNQAINFDPVGNMYISDLFDEYDRCWQAYFNGSNENLSRAFEMAQISGNHSKEKIFIPRFRDVANFAQLPNVKLLDRFEQIKGAKLTLLEKNIVKERLTYSFIWLGKYAPDEYRYQISIKPYNEINISENQWEFLNDLAKIWMQAKEPEKLQSEIFLLAQALNIDLLDAFKALYTVVLDRSHGPRAGWLLKKFPLDMVIERLLLNKSQQPQKNVFNIKTIQKPQFITVDSTLKTKYPHISIGIAIINGVKILHTKADLEKEKKELFSSLLNLTTEQMGKFPEIVSYRKLYKEMGVDWHSRRPSPEALLRRVVLGKGLYSINTCVDAYNLVVLKHRVSVGAFDADRVNFPTVLRYAEEGDKIILLGDEEPTLYTAREIAYYDQIGGYNIDFNFRDAQRTMVTEKTKNIWINVDGVFDITPEQVYRSLQESVEKIVKYCGGNVEFQGIVS